MKTARPSLLSRTLQNLRKNWQRRRRHDQDLRRSMRFEFLESRQMLHGGGLPEYDPNTNFHIHYQLDILVNGDQVVIPKAVGNNVGADSGKIHTHDFSGLIHVHPGPRPTFVEVEEFFEMWRNDTALGNANALFSSTNVMGNVADAGHVVRFYVNGELNTDFENYQIHDNDKILISLETTGNANRPSFDPIPTQTLLGGAPLWLALDGIDPNGGPLTYTVSVSNPAGSANLVQATIPTGNRSLRMDVADFGPMTFQLFDHLAPEVTARIATLANSGFYNRVAVDGIVQSTLTPTATSFTGGASLSATDNFYNDQEVLFTSGPLSGQRARILDYVGATRQFIFAGGSFTAAPAAGATFQIIREITFHRVVPNFVIQAGDPTGTGSGGSPLGDFDDQFHFDLQHTSAGLLSMAKSADDTNDSQFFVTDADARHLDFNHSIFGRLTDGEEIRDALNGVATTNQRPNTPLVINSVSVFTDIENGTLMLKAAEGASGQASVTVTVTDAQGNSFQQTFQVNVSPDTANGAPILVNPPTEVRGDPGQPIQLPQLQAADVEGNPSFFDVAGPEDTPFDQISDYNRDLNTTTGIITYTPKTGFTKPFTSLVVNSNTGEVTITPRAGFIGAFDLDVGVRGVTTTTTSDTFDMQTVEVTVAPPAPTGIDLIEPNNPNEASSTDNITNATSLQFTISGVTSGALVKLMKGTNVVAQGTATGTSISLTTSNLGLLGDGTHGLTATQTVSGEESEASPVLNVTLDTVAPVQFTSTPPTEADVNVALNYNAQHPDEGTAGFKYQLVTPPQGATIDASTGVLIWTPTHAQIGAHTFAISASDAAGNIRTQTLNVTVDEPIPARVEFIPVLTAPDGTTLTTLGANQDFILKLFAMDLRSTQRGVFAAYMDVEWDSTKAVATGPIQFSSAYGGQQSGTVSPGLIDEVGAFAGTNELGIGAHEVFRIPMRTTGTGNLVFIAGPADALPAHQVLVYDLPVEQGGDPTVDQQEVRYSSTTVTINATFNAVNDTFNVNEDVQNFTLNPLANDTNVGTATNVLTISAVGTASNGGTVTIAQDGKSVLYTPVANFFGTETFTYTAKNQNNETATATVTVQVQPQNDVPTAVNDTFQFEKNSTNNLLDVLVNDSFAPDTGETLRVTAVGTGSQGGTITIGNNGANIRYTPQANFTGSETFTYTISDRTTGGLTAQATVTVGVSSQLPTAVADTATATEDAAEAIEIDVLANDLLGEGTALTITAVGTPSLGGTVGIIQSGARVSYKPAANAQGAETFTYTVSNGLGTSTGTVTVTIGNANDPPTAVADTLTAFKNTTVTLDPLANDTSDPDPAENLVIDTVTQGTAGGTITITENGKKVSYAPANNFTGTDTFTYTIKDPGGLSAGPVTVTVNVQEFAPSSLSGFVFFDTDLDGIKDAAESPIGNVTVTLTGTDVNNAAVNRTLTTESDGSYNFNNLLPGNYTLKQTQPAFIIDGRDVAGTQGGNANTNDQIVITNLAQNTNGTGNNFGERGRQAVLTNAQGERAPAMTLRDFFSSNSRDYAIAAFDSSGNELWHTTHGPAWEGFTNGSAALLADKTQIKIDATNPQLQPVTTTLATTDSRVSMLGVQGANQLFRLQGGPAALNFQAAPTSQASGEGEPTSALAAMTEAEGEPTSAAAAPQSMLSPDNAAILDYLYYSTLADEEEQTPLALTDAANWADAVDEALVELAG